MRRPHWLTGVALVLCFACGAARADLPTDIKPVLADPLLKKAQVGISVLRLGTTAADAQTLFELNSKTPLIPASNLKVITTSAALDVLGADFRFRTSLLMKEGSLIVFADGDPSLGDVEMLKKVGWDVDTVFIHWADELKKRGITSVKDVVVDDSVFDQTFAHPNWPEDQLHKRYVAEVGGLNLNANCIDFLVRTTSMGAAVSYSMNPSTKYVSVKNTCLSGSKNAIWLSRELASSDIVLRGEANARETPVSVTIHDPSLYATTVLSETLAARGIAMMGQVRRDTTLRATYNDLKPEDRGSWGVLAIHETPLTTVIARCNKDSMNLYAEALCKRIGYETTKQSGSWQSGTAAVGAFLKHVGVDASEFQLDDGCGLSKRNAISANAMVRVLNYDYCSKQSQAFLSSLSLAGSDGTLEDRFQGSDLRGRVFGKSGFVNGVSTLSGYLKGSDDQWYAFSILINGIPDGTNSGVKILQEKIVKAINANFASVAQQ